MRPSNQAGGGHAARDDGGRIAPLTSCDEHWRDGDEQGVSDVLQSLGGAFAKRLKRKFGSLLGADEAAEMVIVGIDHAGRVREAFDPARGDLEAWLWRIVDREAAAEVRKPWCLQRQSETTRDESYFRQCSDPHAFGHDVDEEHDADCERSRLIPQAMSVLSEKERRILWADACSPTGLAPSDELSELLGIAPETVFSYRSRGKAKLKAELVRLG